MKVMSKYGKQYGGNSNTDKAQGSEDNMAHEMADQALKGGPFVLCGVAGLPPRCWGRIFVAVCHTLTQVGCTETIYPR